MNLSPPVQVFLSMFVASLPTLLVCLTAVIVVFTRRKQCGRAFIWALMGFNLVLVLSFAVPIVQAWVHQWVMQGESAAQTAPALAVISFLWSVLHAAAYALLLVAVLAGRSTANDGSAPLIDGTGGQHS